MTVLHQLGWRNERMNLTALIEKCKFYACANVPSSLPPPIIWKESEWKDKVHWTRQIVGILCGIVWGTMLFRGAQAIIGFVAALYIYQK